MDTSRIAQTTRAQRGIALFRDKRNEIERIAPWTYRIPSCTDRATYTTILDLGYCSCPDHKAAKAQDEWCKHLVATLIANAKHRAERIRAGA